MLLMDKDTLLIGLIALVGIILVMLVFLIIRGWQKRSEFDDAWEMREYNQSMGEPPVGGASLLGDELDKLGEVLDDKKTPVLDSVADFNHITTEDYHVDEESVQGDIVQHESVEYEPVVTQPVVTNPVESQPVERLEPIEKKESVVVPVVEEMVVVVYILAEAGTVLNGVDIQTAMSENEMVIGDMDIYHRRYYIAPNLGGETLFSIANAFEPGHLAMPEGEEETFSTPGLVVFMRLPGPLDANQAFDQMIKTVQALTSSLRAHLHDEQDRPLTRVGIERLREQVMTFCRARSR